MMTSRKARAISSTHAGDSDMASDSVGTRNRRIINSGGGAIAGSNLLLFAPIIRTRSFCL